MGESRGRGWEIVAPHALFISNPAFVKSEFSLGALNGWDALTEGFYNQANTQSTHTSTLDARTACSGQRAQDKHTTVFHDVRLP
jgi:hypothetical protein